MEADCKSAGSAYGGSNPSLPIGKVVEWFMALVLKTSDVQASVGSNPTFSVIKITEILKK
tara:strand:+ start:909 stop:1088 length:180 start_codon:yes stop_codon:yes gene_type:complete